MIVAAPEFIPRALAWTTFNGVLVGVLVGVVFVVVVVFVVEVVEVVVDVEVVVVDVPDPVAAAAIEPPAA